MLLRLTTAIDEERKHAQASDAMQQRVAYLEMQLSEYRLIIDLDNRARIEQQFMSVGQLLGYRALPKYLIHEGVNGWEEYRSWTDELTLAEVIVYARTLVDEERAATERVESRSKLRQVEQALVMSQKRIEELEVERAEWNAWKEAKIVFHAQDTAMRCYLQERGEASIPIQRNGVTVKVVALGNDGVAVSEDHGVIRLSDEELEQGRLWVAKKTGMPVIASRLPVGSNRDIKGA